MQISFLDAAQRDVDEALLLYEPDGPDLARAFLSRLFELVDNVASDPSRFAVDPDSPRRNPARMTTMQRFPFKLVFRFSGDILTIVAVSHFSRNPGHWRDRR